jgi:hypothetical protein
VLILMCAFAMAKKAVAAKIVDLKDMMIRYDRAKTILSKSVSG